MSTIGGSHMKFLVKNQASCWKEMVLEEGVEPSRSFGAPDFESGASANSATPAEAGQVNRLALLCGLVIPWDSVIAARLGVNAAQIISANDQCQAGEE